MSDTSVEAVLNALAGSATEDVQVGNQIGGLQGQMSDIKYAEAKRETATGDAAASLAITSTTGLLAAQNAVQSSKSNFEFDKADPNNYKDILEKDFLANYKAGRALRDQIADKQSVSFFDDPLAFISNQFTIGSDIEKYNKIAANATSSLDTINKIDSTLTNTAQQERATALTLNVASIAENAKIARNAMDKAASQASYEALQSNVNAIQAIHAGNEGAVNRMHEQWQVLKSDEQLVLQKKSNELANRRLQLELDKEQEKINSREMDLEIIRRGRAIARLPDFNPAQIGNLKLMLTTPEGKMRFQKEYELGLTALNAPEGQVKLGYGVADTALTAASLKGNFDSKKDPSAPAVLYGVNLLRDIPANVGTKKEAVESYVNTRAAQDIASWNSNPENSPLYKLPSLQTIAENSTVANSEFFKQVLAASALAKSQGMPAADMLTAGLEKVKEGKLTASELATGLAKYIEVGTNLNSANNYLGAIPPQEGYKVSIPGTGLIGGNKYDLSKPEQIAAAAAKLLAKAATNESAQQGDLADLFAGNQIHEGIANNVNAGKQSIKDNVKTNNNPPDAYSRAIGQ